jgi:OHCU decarboxylase
MQPIAALNRAEPEAFAEAIRPLFEAAPPLARALYAQRPFTSYEALIETAEALALAMPFQEQAVVLSAHPRIGASPGTLSAASYREQGYSTEAGMARLEVERIYPELEDLNERYEQKFGFRFVVFVNGRPKAEIIDVLRHRIERGSEEELAAGLREMFLIARDRLA